MLTAVFLVCMTALAYLPALRDGGYIWDDKAHVSGCHFLENAAGLRAIWTRIGSRNGGTQQYYPLTYTSFWAEYRLWGPDPAGYHLTNVLLHGLNAALVWLILLRLRVPGALLAALIFALHPVHVESVAWITQRKNVLSGFFYLLSLRCFLKFFGVEENEGRTSAGTGAASPGLYAAGSVLFVCALASKSVTATLPAAVLLALWWKRGRIAWKELLLVSPLLAAGAASGLVTAYLEKHHVGASGADWALSPAERFILAGRALWFYAGKLAWPSPLMFIYPRWDITGEAWPQYLLPSGALAVISALWRLRVRLGRGPLAAVLFFSG
ncbi:MAG TPA: hypothetical protein PL037_09700, partial [Elusimicrobiales bacterium]|nr:hypothetical protein [Elusimicrobiales bacterium]